MTPQEKYIRETNQYDRYVAWLESQIESKNNEENPDDITEEALTIMESTRKYVDSFFKQSDYETSIIYDDPDLNYQTQIIFPRTLSLTEKEDIENIINYWSNIPYVSVEGYYGIEWMKVRDNSAVLILIDFTKSASDDYMMREILEKLAEWVWQGTPKRKDGSQKYEGVVKPLVVRADCP